MITPDFFIVGAPKCGTSALHDFLGQHPDIFVPEEKELLLFATDLSYPSWLTPKEFEAHFTARKAESRAGTAQVSYMQSRLAAAEIKAARPDADIIVMVRDPVELVHSWHGELLFEVIEDLDDFADALAAEPERRQGRHIPQGARNAYVESLFYSDVGALSDQLARYLDVFDRDRVHVIVHDDLVADAQLVCRGVYEFLGVDPSFVPSIREVNGSKTVRSRRLQRLYYASHSRSHRVAKRLVPSALRRRLLTQNTVDRRRPAIDPQVRDRLRELFRPQVLGLSAQLGRDLSAWLEPAGVVGS